MMQYREQEQAGWTDADTQSLISAISTFRDTLPQREQEMFTAILAAAAKSADDTSGHFYMLLRPPRPSVLGSDLDATLNNAQRIVREFADSLGRPLR